MRGRRGGGTEGKTPRDAEDYEKIQSNYGLANAQEARDFVAWAVTKFRLDEDEVIHTFSVAPDDTQIISGAAHIGVKTTAEGDLGERLVMLDELQRGNRQRIVEAFRRNESAQPVGASLGNEAEQAAAAATIDRVIASLQMNYEHHQSVVDYRDPFMRKGLVDDPEFIVVGDLHGNPENLWGILSVNDNYEKILRGEAVLVLLGDVVHPERGSAEELGNMNSSVVIHRLAMNLMARLTDEDGYLRKVVYIPGNHENIDADVGKRGRKEGQLVYVPQSLLFRQKLENELDVFYSVRYETMLRNSPLLFVADGVVADHAGPVNAASSVTDIRKARATDTEDPWLSVGHKSRIVHEAQWRTWSAAQHVNGAAEYTPRNVTSFLRLPGIEQPDAVFLVGHNAPAVPSDDYYHELMPNHYVIYASRNNYGYASVKGGKLSFKRAMPIKPPPADWNQEALLKTPEDRAIQAWAKAHFKANGWVEGSEDDYNPEYVANTVILPKALPLLDQYQDLAALEAAKAEKERIEDEKFKQGDTVELYGVAAYELAAELKKIREKQSQPAQGQSLGIEKTDMKRRTFITAGLSAAGLALLGGGWYAANYIAERPKPAATDEERASVAAKIRENLMSRLWDLTDDPESEPWRRQAAEDTLRDIYRARNDGDLLQGEYFRGQYRTPDGVVWFQRAVLENLYQSALNDALADPDTKRIVDSDPEEIQGRAFYWPEPVITPKQREVYSQNLGRGWGKFVYRYPALNHELFNSPVQLMRLLKSNLFDFEEQAKAFVRLLEHLENH